MKPKKKVRDKSKIPNMAFTVFGKYLIFISILINLFDVHAVEEIVIIHAPRSVKFLSSEPVRSSYVGDILSGVLAYTIRSNIEWHGLAPVSPWKRPKAVAVIQMEGCDNNKIDLPLNGAKFLFENAGDLPSQYDLLAHRTEERYNTKSPVMMRMDMGDELHESKISQPVLLKSVPADPKKRFHMAVADPELGEPIRESIFNSSVLSDKLLIELATTKEVMKALSNHKVDLPDKIPDIYWFKYAGIQNICCGDNANSLHCSEASRLSRQMLSEVEGAMRNIYDDNVVITVIKTNGDELSLGHKNRRLLETTEAPLPENEYNLATKWDPMFPVTFIIMVFIGIFLTLSVLGISVAIWNMDPGRDSIIYRMTSQRMKKD